MPDAAPTTDGSPEQRLQARRIADLAGLFRMSGPMRPCDTSPTVRALSKARPRVPSGSGPCEGFASIGPHDNRRPTSAGLVR